MVLLDAETTDSNRLLSGYLSHDLLVLDENVWIATSGNGLICFNLKNQTSEIFTVEAGLPSNYINSIAFAEGSIFRIIIPFKEMKDRGDSVISNQRKSTTKRHAYPDC